MAIHISKDIKKYLESIGGGQCKICNEWDDKDRFIDNICSDCNKEIDEIVGEAEDW